VNLRFASALLALIALLLAVQTALAGSVANATWGWVTVRRATTPSYSPAARDQGNSAAKPNQVSRSGTGDYNVSFPDINNLSPTAGIPIVTAMSSNPRFCSLIDWGINDTTMDANTLIRCFSRDGEAIDSQFSTIYVRGGGDSGTSAYLLADQQGAASYTPSDEYNFNSSGTPNTMSRTSTGVYHAHLPTMPADSGNIQLSADGDFLCKITGRHAGTNELIVDVNCYDPAGNPTDGRFTLLYVDGVGPTTVLRPNASYMFANKPSTSTYTPTLAYRYSSVGMSASVHRTGTGKYSATLNGLPKGGGAWVTAVGTDKAFCQLTSIRTDASPQKVGVACYKPNGSAVDSKFMLAYTK
jgi:hypothetical protein